MGSRTRGAAKGEINHGGLERQTSSKEACSYAKILCHVISEPKDTHICNAEGSAYACSGSFLVCEVCLDQNFKYTCPQCQIVYVVRSGYKNPLFVLILNVISLGKQLYYM